MRFAGKPKVDGDLYPNLSTEITEENNYIFTIFHAEIIQCKVSLTKSQFSKREKPRYRPSLIQISLS